MTQSCGPHKEDPYGGNSAAVRGLNVNVNASPLRTTETNDGDTAALAEKVKAALSKDAGLKGADIKVAVGPEREVVLSGEVAGREQSKRAAEIATAVPGVVGVRNKLGVAGDDNKNAGGNNNDAPKSKPR